ncbi:hypothetical protein Glove_351g4 [Diversispora epigaea]|uniref:Uncharacterized protein n=1 Tax=Diversispora epigaea TaxID=1348612 RepID=A0A397HCX1_9GLOM|nr:hypothetical protein Glove_351g4 [Diversispora epigaea]
MKKRLYENEDEEINNNEENFDLQKIKCKCDLNLLPSKSNRTKAVKYAFMRSFEPSWTQVKLKFIQDKITEYNYKLNFNKSFKFSLCGKCNSILVKLNPPKLKPKTDSNTSISSIDLFTNSNMSISRDNSEENLLHLTNGTTTFTTIDLDDEFSDDKNEFEISFKIFIKLADGTSIPAKWYKETIASIDEFLYIIHEKDLNSDEEGEINYSKGYKNKNKVSKTSLLPCLNKDGHKDTHVEHFYSKRTTNTNIYRKRSSSSTESQLAQQQQMTFSLGNQYTSVLFYSPFQFYSQYNPFQQQNFCQPETSLLIPSLAEFLKEIDNKENTNNYYQNFLKEFET